MFRSSIFFTLLIIVALSGCGEEPYVEQINKAHDILNQGKLENSEEKLKQAAEEYRKAYSYALFALEKEYDALFNLAVLHAFTGQFQNCIEVLTQAYEIRRDDPSLFYYWGMCHANQAKVALDEETQQRNVDQAVDTYQRGLSLFPTDHLLNYGLGILYGFITEDYPRALEHLKTAHQAQSDDINILFALANISYKVGQPEESAEFFRTIMRLTQPGTPSYEQAKVNLEKIR